MLWDSHKFPWDDMGWDRKKCPMDNPEFPPSAAFHLVISKHSTSLLHPLRFSFSANLNFTCFLSL